MRASLHSMTTRVPPAMMFCSNRFLELLRYLVVDLSLEYTFHLSLALEKRYALTEHRTRDFRELD